MTRAATYVAVCQLSVPGAQGGTEVCQKSEPRARLKIKMRAPLRWCAKVAAEFANRCCTRRCAREEVLMFPNGDPVRCRSCCIRLSQIVSNLLTVPQVVSGMQIVLTASSANELRRIIRKRVIASHLVTCVCSRGKSTQLWTWFRISAWP